MGTVTPLRPPVLITGKTDWPVVPKPRQLPANEYLPVSRDQRSIVFQMEGIVARLRADSAGGFITRTRAQQHPRLLSTLSELVEAFAKGAAQ